MAIDAATMLLRTYRTSHSTARGVAACATCCASCLSVQPCQSRACSSLPPARQDFADTDVGGCAGVSHIGLHAGRLRYGSRSRARRHISSCGGSTLPSVIRSVSASATMALTRHNVCRPSRMSNTLSPMRYGFPLSNIGVLSSRSVMAYPLDTPRAGRGSRCTGRAPDRPPTSH